MATEKSKWTPDQIKEKIEKVIEQQRHENKCEHFTSITSEEIEKKLKRVKSPMIVSQGWNSTTLGGVVNYNLGIFNPDPARVIWLFAHVWVGSGNIDPVVGTYLLNVDARFPRLTQPVFAGLTLAAGTSTTLSFALKVPSTIEKTDYLGSSCLMRFNWHDLGMYLGTPSIP